MPEKFEESIIRKGVELVENPWATRSSTVRTSRSAYSPLHTKLLCGNTSTMYSPPKRGWVNETTGD